MSIEDLKQSPALQLARKQLLDKLGIQWQVGQWLPPVSKLASLIDAGHVNTHRAIKCLAEEGYLLPLRGKGTKILRVPESSTSATVAANNISSNLAACPVTQPRPIIAIIRTRETDAIINRMVDAFIAGTTALNPDYHFCMLDEPEEEVTLDRDVDFAVVFNPYLTCDQHTIRQRAKHTIIVSTGQPAFARFPLESLDLITVDQTYVGYLAGEHLKQLGCESVCFLGRGIKPNQYDLTSRSRLQGLEESWGTQIKSDRLMYGRYYSPTTGDHALQHWRNLKPRPLGIFAASDELARGFLIAAIEQGYEAGRDFHLIGVDGQQRSQICSSLSLTTIRLPVDAMGSYAASTVKQRVAEGAIEPVHITLGCEIVLGSNSPSIQKHQTKQIVRSHHDASTAK